ncbi:MAG TPA: hypothetical protein PKE55_12155 [Kiritimatiellia bacterium]|nr:hypothetical protein [Kiritimatiellia bacterium]
MALVIVLGLLSVLVIFSVAFSVSMRTERMATSAFLDVVKARHLAHTALNRVIGVHLHDEMRDEIYPAFEALGSGSQNEIRLLGDGFMESPMVFVPMDLRQAAFDADNVGWVELRDNNNNFFGEYAYLIVNNSGLLDGNVIGARESENNPRQRGTDPREIRFHPDILDGLERSSLAQFRQIYGKFESVPEMYYLGSSGVDGVMPPFTQRGGGQAPTSGSYVNSMHVFSRVPYGTAGVALRENTDLAFIGGDPGAWDRGAIESALSDLEQPGQIPNLTAFIDALYDYADEGYVPHPEGDEARQFRRFSAKPVPMINEVIVSNSLQMVVEGTQTVLLHRTYINVETWFPFPNDPDNAEFSVRLSQPPSYPQVSPPYPEFQNPGTLVSGPEPPTFNPNDGNGYNVTTFVYQQRQEVFGEGQPPYAGGQGSFAVRLVLEGDIEVTYNGAVVDKVFGPWGGNDFRLVGQRPVLAVGEPARGIDTQARAVNDPRINWNPQDNSQWRGVSPPTPGDRNNATIIAPASSSDELDFMYARRGPILSVGEVGYLLYDSSKPWQTVRLLGQNPSIGSELINRLTLLQPSDYPRRGLVNLNSLQTNAIAASIWEMPLERYPGGSITRVSVNQARGFANQLITSTLNNGTMTNLSHLAERLTEANVDGIFGTANDKFTRESVIRNSLGLWTTRHNLFTIFLAARTFAQSYDPSNGAHRNNRANFVTAEQRAVAVVWRDPLITTDQAGNDTNQSIIQFFHWFSGAFGD